jgi:hypothetical protein
MTFLNYEFSACLATAIAIKQVAPKLADVPLLLKVVHFTFVGLFSIIGVAGFHILVWICFRHVEFTEAFSNPNPFGISRSLLQSIGYGFALAGVVLFIASMMLCKLHDWARRLVIRLALPYSVFYPCIMSTMSHKDQLHSDFYFAFIVTLVLSVLSIFAMIFYSSQYVRKHLIVAA